MAKRRLKNGAVLSTMWAVFNGEKQITRWDPRKDKVIASFERSSNRTGSSYTVRKQVFFTPAPEQGGAS